MHLRAVAFLTLTACAPAIAPGPSSAGSPEKAAEQPPSNSPGLEGLIADLCEKEVVLLGEAEHGDGSTWEVKTDITRALVERCGFDSVFIESGIYDFIAYNRSLAGGAVTRKDLANAIGSIWADARQTQRWISFLHEAASTDKVQVMGLDDQIHSTALYAQRELPRVLAAHLPQADRERCESTIARHHVWGYDETHPHTPAYMAEVEACLQQIRGVLAKQDANEPSEELAMTANLLRWISRDFMSDGDSVFNARDESMFENLSWHRKRLGTRKTIVWCATIHAAKTVDPFESLRGLSPLGSYIHQRYGDRAAAIGFSAQSGASHPRGREPRVLPEAPPESIEGQVLAPEQSLHYLDTDKLRALGTVEARPISHTFRRAAWHEVLDGLVVLRQETPAGYDANPEGNP